MSDREKKEIKKVLVGAFCVVRKLSAHAGFPKGRKIFTPGRISI
jgi:hypothetical protein